MTADEWEVRITVLRNGEEVQISDSLGDTATEALYMAHNDLENWAARQDEEREDDD